MVKVRKNIFLSDFNHNMEIVVNYSCYNIVVFF